MVRFPTAKEPDFFSPNNSAHLLSILEIWDATPRFDPHIKQHFYPLPSVRWLCLTKISHEESLPSDQTRRKLRIKKKRGPTCLHWRVDRPAPREMWCLRCPWLSSRTHMLKCLCDSHSTDPPHAPPPPPLDLHVSSHWLRPDCWSSTFWESPHGGHISVLNLG